MNQNHNTTRKFAGDVMEKEIKAMGLGEHIILQNNLVT